MTAISMNKTIDEKNFCIYCGEVFEPVDLKRDTDGDFLCSMCEENLIYDGCKELKEMESDFRRIVTGRVR